MAVAEASQGAVLRRPLRLLKSQSGFAFIQTRVTAPEDAKRIYTLGKVGVLARWMP